MEQIVMMFFDRIKPYNYGFITEYIAIYYLFFCGYKILKHRYKTNFGEIDIICKKGNNIIAVEVKGRRNSNMMEVDEVISYNQIQRINNAIDLFVVKNSEYEQYNVRVDAIIISGFFKLKHIKNI